MKPRSIELHIEDLVLDGFPPGDRYPIAEAIERELTRLFVEQGEHTSLARGRELGRLDAGAFEARPGSHTGAIGAQIGQLIYRGLKR